MHKKGLKFLRTVMISICLFAEIFFLNNLPATGDDGKEYEKYLSQPRVHSRIINYLRREQKIEQTVKLQPQDIIILAVIDLPLSLFCLWLAILILTGTKTIAIKRYAWFLFIFNLTRFILLAVFKVIWQVLDFLIIKLQPDLMAAFKDNFCLIVIISAAIIYPWLLARTFGLNLYGAFSVFFSSHLFYFSVIFLLFTFAGPKENPTFNLAKENLGVRQVLRSYLSDVDKIVTGQNMLSFIKVRPFHL